VPQQTPSDGCTDGRSVIAPAIGEQLVSLSRDALELLPEFTTALAGSMTQRIALLEDALASGDTPGLVAIAQRVRKGSRFWGAWRLAEACARLDGAAPRAPGQQLRAAEEYEHVRQRLQEPQAEEAGMVPSG